MLDAGAESYSPKPSLFWLSVRRGGSRAGPLLNGEATDEWSVHRIANRSVEHTGRAKGKRERLYMEDNCLSRLRIDRGHSNAQVR